MRTTGRLALALIVAALAIVVPAAARDPAGPTGATILFRSPPVAEAQGGPNRAGLVIRYSDGRAETRCVDFAEAQISGYELLRRSSLPLAVAQGSEGTAICKINGDGCDPAQCLTCRGGPYWSYFHSVNGDWQYSVVGAAGYQVRTGALEGWTFGNGARPPAASFAQVCAAQAAPTATFTAVPDAPTPTFAAVPAGRAGPAPPPIVLVGAATASAAAAPSPSPTPPPATATPAAVSGTAATPTVANALSPTPTPATASMASDRPASPSPTAAPPTAAPTRPPEPSPPASPSPPAPQPSPTASAASAPGAAQPAAMVAAPGQPPAPVADSSAPSESLLPLGEGQDEGVKMGAAGTRTAPPGTIPSPLPEGEATHTGAGAPPGPLAGAALNPQPSTLNPSSTLNPLGPGHLIFGAISLVLIGYLAFAGLRPK